MEYRDVSYNLHILQGCDVCKIAFVVCLTQNHASGRHRLYARWYANWFHSALDLIKSLCASHIMEYNYHGHDFLQFYIPLHIIKRVACWPFSVIFGWALGYPQWLSCWDLILWKEIVTLSCSKMQPDGNISDRYSRLVQWMNGSSISMTLFSRQINSKPSIFCEIVQFMRILGPVLQIFWISLHNQG